MVLLPERRAAPAHRNVQLSSPPMDSSNKISFPSCWTTAEPTTLRWNHNRGAQCKKMLRSSSDCTHEHESDGGTHVALMCGVKRSKCGCCRSSCLTVWQFKVLRSSCWLQSRSNPQCLAVLWQRSLNRYFKLWTAVSEEVWVMAHVYFYTHIHVKQSEDVYKYFITSNNRNETIQPLSIHLS